METRSSKLNRKRQREQEKPPCELRKSQRLLKSKSSMKITDLNDDCLQNIFNLLDLRSLFNVAVANKWLRPAAGVVFKRKFGIKTICINNNRRHRPFKSFPYHIIITGLKMCLQLLRCLGSSINGLKILYKDWNGKQCEYIHQYVNKYCAESLVAIEFSDKPTHIPLGPFEEPFINVQEVKIFHCDLGSQRLLFDEWFSNMRSLKLVHVCTLRRIDASKFKHLNDLSIYVGEDESGFTVNKATRLLQQLPQLHSLTIWGFGFTLSTLPKIIQDNRAICNLKTTIYKFTVAASVLDIQQLIHEHPLLIELEIMNISFLVGAIIPLISQLNALKRFGFQTVNRLEYDRLVPQLDNEWRSSFSHEKPPNYRSHYVQLER